MEKGYLKLLDGEKRAYRYNTGIESMNMIENLPAIGEYEETISQCQCST